MSSWREELITHTTSDEACGRCYMEWGTTPKNDATIAGHESHSRIKVNITLTNFLTKTKRDPNLDVGVFWQAKQDKKKETTQPKNMTKNV